jgi:hypothetical protein
MVDRWYLLPSVREVVGVCGPEWDQISGRLEPLQGGQDRGAYLDETGHVVVPDSQHALIGRAAVYARVCTHKQRDDLDRQAQQMTQFANAAGLMLLFVLRVKRR